LSLLIRASPRLAFGFVPRQDDFLERMVKAGAPFILFYFDFKRLTNAAMGRLRPSVGQSVCLSGRNASVRQRSLSRRYYRRAALPAWARSLR
jgi:hypothetical protein